MADVDRPEPGWHPGEGFHLEAAPKPGWRLDEYRRCRWMVGRRSCGKPSVAALNRGQYIRYRGRVDSWWGYCADHLYGNWIEDDQVMGWRMIADEPALTPSADVPACRDEDPAHAAALAACYPPEYQHPEDDHEQSH